MKRITFLLLFICAVNFNLFSQVDPCYVLTEVLREVDKAVVQGKYDDALRMLEQVKNNPKNSQCPEMKDGIVDYKIKDVKEKIKKEKAEKCPDNNHPHAIDLGLPSGTKWACCNVGATKPEGNGSYYAWGENEEKSVYSKSSYYKAIGMDICGTQYDVAHVKWGGRWQMPSREQCDELIEKCKYEITEINGVRGRRFIGPNGNTVFFPFSGKKHDNTFYSFAHDYWTGTHSDSSGIAYHLHVGQQYTGGNPVTNVLGQYNGCTVRPVFK